MSEALRAAVGALNPLLESNLDERSRELVEAAITQAVTDRLTRSDRIVALARAISDRQAAELAKLYGPTGFNTAHLDPELIAQELQRSGEL